MLDKTRKNKRAQKAVSVEIKTAGAGVGATKAAIGSARWSKILREKIAVLPKIDRFSG